MNNIITEKPIINIEYDYYSKIISEIIIGGWEENDINNYYGINSGLSIEYPQLKVFFSIPFPSNFSNFEVKLFIYFFSIFILMKNFFLKNHNFFLQV